MPTGEEETTRLKELWTKYTSPDGFWHDLSPAVTQILLSIAQLVLKLRLDPDNRTTYDNQITDSLHQLQEQGNTRYQALALKSSAEILARQARESLIPPPEALPKADLQTHPGFVRGSEGTTIGDLRTKGHDPLSDEDPYRTGGRIKRGRIKRGKK